MLPYVFLAAMVGSAVAAPTPGIDGPTITVGEWTVRADWSRCANSSASEVVLQGRIAAQGTTAGTGIVDFQVPAYGFNGSLVLKPVGSLGFGSNLPPAKVDVVVLEEADADGNFGIATYTPAVNATEGINREKIANVAWFTDKNNSINPTSQITTAALERGVELSAATKTNPSFLRVYYCSAPQLP